MWTDEIVEEVRRVREAHSATHGHDLRRIVQDLRRRQDASGKEAVSLQPRPPRIFKRASGASER
jgi:hypothetical protein